MQPLTNEIEVVTNAGNKLRKEPISLPVRHVIAMNELGQLLHRHQFVSLLVLRPASSNDILLSPSTFIHYYKTGSSMYPLMSTMPYSMSTNTQLVGGQPERRAFQLGKHRHMTLRMMIAVDTN